MNLSFFPSAYSRDDEGFLEIRLVNQFFERTPGGPGPNAIIPRPGITLEHSQGAGPIRAIYKQNGTISGDTISVSGSGVYDVTSLVGTLNTSSGYCEIDGFTGGIVVIDAVDGTAWFFNGASFTQVTDADLPEVCTGVYYRGRWIYGGKNSSIIYWSAIGDPTSIDGLAFATAESSTDKVIKLLVVGDDLVIIGQESVEFWYATGDADQPIQPYTNRSFGIGSLSAASAIKVDNTFCFLGTDRLPYRAEATPRVLIDQTTGTGYGIAERLKALSSADVGVVPAWSATILGHPFYFLNISGTSWGYDISTGQWFECTLDISVSTGREKVFIGGTEASLYTFTPGTTSDVGSSIERVAMAFVPVADGAVRCEAFAVMGQSTHSQAELTLRYYDEDWSDPVAVTSTRKVCVWRKLGLMRPPGRYFEISSNDDDILISLSGAQLNPRRI